MRINNKKVSDEKISTLLRDIKKKKELSKIKDDFVKEEIKKYLAQNQKVLSKLISSKKHNELKRSSLYKSIIKEVRKVLHKVYGAYQILNKNREKYLLELSDYLKKKGPKGKDYFNIHEKILSTNLSTKERLKIYPSLYKEIFSITGLPKKILDLGSGINPISYPFFKINNLDYLAYELGKQDVDFLNNYFKISAEHTGLKGKAKLINLHKVKTLPKTDVCFLFKVLESFEIKKGHKLSEELLKKIKSKWVIVSFPTKTLSQKKMKFQRRGWFEMMLKRNNYQYRKIIKENETFYIIKISNKDNK